MALVELCSCYIRIFRLSLFYISVYIPAFSKNMEPGNKKHGNYPFKLTTISIEELLRYLIFRLLLFSKNQ